MGSFDKKASVSHVVKSGHLFKEKEILTMKKSCDKLYGYLWKASKFSKRRKEKKGLRVKSGLGKVLDFFLAAFSMTMAGPIEPVRVLWGVQNAKKIWAKFGFFPS